MLTVLITTFGLVFVAELGDKTQVLVAWLASRYDPWRIMAGVLLGSAAIHGLAVVVGALVGSFVPQTAIEVGAGVLFAAFAVFAFREAGRDESEDAEEAASPGLMEKRPALGTAAVFFLAELGDKTQIMVVALAAQAASGTLGGSDGAAGPGVLVALWVGAVLAMVASDGLAVAAGSFLGARVSRRSLAIVSGVLFAGFAALTLGRVVLGAL